MLELSIIFTVFSYGYSMFIIYRHRDIYRICYSDRDYRNISFLMGLFWIFVLVSLYHFELYMMIVVLNIWNIFLSYGNKQDLDNNY